jgi:predicted peptidase
MDKKLYFSAKPNKKICFDEKNELYLHLFEPLATQEDEKLNPAIVFFHGGGG